MRLETVEVVREKERELFSRKLYFLKREEKIKKQIKPKRIDYIVKEMERLKLLHDSLSFL